MSGRGALIGGVMMGLIALVAIGLITGGLDGKQDDVIILGGSLAAVGSMVTALADRREGCGKNRCSRGEGVQVEKE